MIRVYLIGSLRNREYVQKVAEHLRVANYEVFDDWLAPGPEADDKWKEYEETRGRTYEEALSGFAAQHVFDFDYHHIHRADIGILVMPCGKSGHMELGYMIGRGKRCYVLMDKPDRWDVMYQFAERVFFSLDELVEGLPFYKGEGNE